MKIEDIHEILKNNKNIENFKKWFSWKLPPRKFLDMHRGTKHFYNSTSENQYISFQNRFWFFDFIPI